MWRQEPTRAFGLLWPLVVNGCSHLAIFRVTRRFKYCPNLRGLEESKILGLFTEDTAQTLMGTILSLSTTSWLSNLLHLGFSLDPVGAGWLAIHLVCLCCHMVGRAAFSLYLCNGTYRCMAGKVLGTAPQGQLMSDTNLCISFKAANMALCVNYQTLHSWHRHQ